MCSLKVLLAADVSVARQCYNLVNGCSSDPHNTTVHCQQSSTAWGQWLTHSTMIVTTCVVNHMCPAQQGQLVSL